MLEAKIRANRRNGEIKVLKIETGAFMFLRELLRIYKNSAEYWQEVQPEFYPSYMVLEAFLLLMQHSESKRTVVKTYTLRSDKPRTYEKYYEPIELPEIPNPRFKKRDEYDEPR